MEEKRKAEEESLNNKVIEMTLRNGLSFRSAAPR